MTLSVPRCRHYLKEFQLQKLFIEELGWRGYVLDRLQEKRSALVSSLILGVVWSLWHLPLFFVQGSYQAGLGVGTLGVGTGYTHVTASTTHGLRRGKGVGTGTVSVIYNSSTTIVGTGYQ